MKILHASSEDCLETILALQKEKGMTRSIDVTRRMKVSKSGVYHAISILREGGFPTMDKDFFLHLTDIGREIAERTYEEHYFFTRLLTDAGVKPKTAGRDAYRMGHAISEDSFQHLKKSTSEKK